MSIKSMEVQELKAKLDAGEKVVLVDCREQNEWDAGHIEAAKLLPLSVLEDKYRDLTDKDAQIVLQCRSGKRSYRAAQFLLDQGYNNLSNLEGGILAWQDEGYPVSE